MRVACFPLLDDNPYQALLNGELRRKGVSFDTGARPSLRWAIRDGRKLDVLHLHWLENLVGRDDSERLHQAKVAARTARLLAVLLILKASGVRLVWTVHNLLPHDTRHERRDLILARGLARLVDEMCASSKYAAARIEQTYGRGPVRVTYHATFGNRYPRSGASREEIRAQYGLPPDAKVFLAFGLVRAYKQLDGLAAAFHEVHDPDARLLIVGRPVPKGVEREIERRGAGDERIVYRWEHLPDEGVGDLHAAADVAVLPYRDVFSSSALLLALAHGLPVVAPAGTTATEVAEPPVVLPYADGELTAALAAAPRIDERTRAAALATAGRFTWDQTAEAVLAAYRGESS